MPRPSEFDLIRDYFTRGFPQADDVLLGIGDDCSLVNPPLDMELAQSIDTQVAGVHFPADAPAHLIAARALRCAVSDLAALGAVPQGFHLALTLPDSDPSFLAEFARGLRQTAHELEMPLLGGDTTRGSVLTVTVAVQGWLPQGLGLRRTGAIAGQDIWLSGKIGAAALILDEVLKTPDRDDAATAPYYHPQVHVSFGHVLLSLATSAIDISDGLLQDARHIARASGVNLEFDANAIPTSVPREHPQWTQCLTGGDDYQLLFTAPKDAEDRILACAQTINLGHCTRVGKVIAATESDSGNITVIANGTPLNFDREGYEHF
jgi:thiamine-monophosphate kinase